MATTVPLLDLETEGKELSGSFLTDEKQAAVRCWMATVEQCGHTRQVLADAAKVSEGHFSLVSSGQRGDLLGLIYAIGRTYPLVRRDFIARLSELELIDPLALASEQVARAAMRFLRLRGDVPARMAKATARKRRVGA